MKERMMYYFIGFGLILVDLVIFAQGVFVSQIVQTIKTDIGGSGYSDFYMYFPKSIIAVLIIIFLMALYVGYYIPIIINKEVEK